MPSSGIGDTCKRLIFCSSASRSLSRFDFGRNAKKRVFLDFFVGVCVRSATAESASRGCNKKTQ